MNGVSSALSTRKQQFRDKDIIYRQGDAATRAFTVIAGKVELIRTEDGEERHVALLGPGKTLGDGDVGKGRHQETAIAAGTVTLRPLDRQALAIVKPKEQPSGGLLARLLDAFVRKDGNNGAHKAESGGRTFSLFNWFREIKEASHPDPTRIEIRVSPRTAPSDSEDAAAAQDDLLNAVLAGFDGLEGVRARPLKKPLEMPDVPEDTPPEEAFRRLHWSARQALAQAEADLAVLFEPTDDGKALAFRFLPLGIQTDDPAGALQPAETLTLPAPLDAPFGRLLTAVALGAAVPLTDAKKRTLSTTLPAAVEAAGEGFEAAAGALKGTTLSVARLFQANLLCLMAGPKGELETYHRAADLFGEALEELSKEGQPALAKAAAHRGLGAILPVLGPALDEPIETPGLGDADDADRPRNPLEQAAAHLEAAAEVFTREDYPKDWAALQVRLGQVCYRIDLQDGDQERLKRSLNHYQAALHVYNRIDFPTRWGEVMNAIGQVAAILGEQLKSVELLEKAIEACGNALEVRRKLDNPLLWASTQNNLGSALFMLAKQTQDENQIEAAREAFSLAKTVYEAHGAHRLALITEKNLSRLERLAQLNEPKAPPPLPWEPRDFAPHLADEEDDEEEDAADALDDGADGAPESTTKGDDRAYGRAGGA